MTGKLFRSYSCGFGLLLHKEVRCAGVMGMGLPADAREQQAEARSRNARALRPLEPRFWRSAGEWSRLAACSSFPSSDGQ